jgi:hypothetical protein
VGIDPRLAVALEDRKGWSFGARIYGYIVMEEETRSAGRCFSFLPASELAGGRAASGSRSFTANTLDKVVVSGAAALSACHLTSAKIFKINLLTEKLVYCLFGSALVTPMDQRYPFACLNCTHYYLLFCLSHAAKRRHFFASLKWSTFA